MIFVYLNKLFIVTVMVTVSALYCSYSQLCHCNSPAVSSHWSGGQEQVTGELYRICYTLFPIQITFFITYT